jgi:hypothetical protein
MLISEHVLRLWGGAATRLRKLGVLFNESLQGSQSPNVFFAEGIKDERSGDFEEAA